MHFFFTGGGGKKLWKPSNIGAALWLDANDAGTFTLNGSTVSQWDDKSGNNNHAVQGTAASQPTYTASQSIFGGRPSVTWPSVTNNRVLVTPSFSSVEWYFVLAYADGVRATWVVASQGLFATSNTLAVSAIGLAAGTIASAGLWYTANQYNTIRSNGASATVDANVSTVALPMPQIIFQSRRGAGALTPNAGWSIGRDRDLANRGWSGPMGEVLAFGTALGVSDRQKLEGYLAYKWWGAGSLNPLPSDHPYKDKPPLA